MDNRVIEAFVPNYFQSCLFSASPQPFIVARAHRRAGKSTALAEIAFGALFFPLEQTEILYVAPTMAMSRSFTDALESRMHPCMDRVYTHTKHPYKIQIENSGGNRLYVVSAQTLGRSTCGQGADVILVDEAAYIDDKAWEALKPIIKGDLHRHQSPKVIVVGTATRGPSYFRTLCTDKEYQHTVHRVFVPVLENPDYTKENIKEIRSFCTPEDFETEWLTMFTD